MDFADDLFDAALADLEAARERAKEAGKVAAKRMLAAFMVAHPEVEAVRWRQYTPYFNDGDSCVFGVRDAYVKIKDAPEDAGDYEDGFLEAYDKEIKARPSLKDNLDKLNEFLSRSEEVLESIFGDHVQVTVGREGEAEVEEYSHD